jgi:hypothetical protein
VASAFQQTLGIIQLTLKRENIYKDITISVASLLEIARQYTFNDISNNCSFILSEIIQSNNLTDKLKLRKETNDKKIPKPLNKIIIELDKLYSNLYDINLFIYKSDKYSTIIEIQYFPRSSLNKDYQEMSSATETMLHCKVSIPPYASDTKEKFDINWELGTFNHKWKMMLWRLKMFISLKQYAGKTQTDR